MLRDVGVRTKLLAVLAIPTALLVVVTALLVTGQVSAATRAGQVNALTDVAIQVNRVVHSLQEERSATLGYLQDQDEVAKARMVGQRQYTNQQLRSLRALVADSPVEQMPATVGTAVARSTAAHAELATARSSVDAGRFFATETDVFYAKIIRTDLDLPGVIATTGTTELAQRLQAYEAVSSAIEYAAHERDLVEIALLRGTMTEADFALSSALVAQQRQTLQDFQRDAPGQVFTRLDDALAKSEISAIDQVRRALPDLLKGQDPNVGGSVEWVGAANSRIAPMTSAESALVADIATVAADTQNAQERRSLLLVVGSLLGLGLALMLAVGLARRITRPLRRLTVAAGEIGAELPHMVERMQTPGEGPGVVIQPIKVESHDEIGRLAEAFNTVNDVTVQVAQEQAALRASIAEMFVNVARRNQVLLGRQLAQLDKMEAREEDPDVLDSLFKLDHLATRMRRNAESLLVLAGIDSTRRLRSTLPLSDVIRTAVGEIESFDRIDLSMSEDPEVSGRHALTVAHLLAELLENATHFSNPDTRVVVSASVTGRGVDVTVTDYGLGMSEDEITDANDKIAHPPVAEIAVSQRLGLFVVGRLAARLGATVELRRGRAAGTVVAIALPTAVFEGMTAPEPVDEQVVAPVLEVDQTDEVVDEIGTADAAEELSSETPAPARPARGGLLRRGRRRAPAPAPVADPAELADPVELADDIEPFDEVEHVGPAADVEPVEPAEPVVLVELVADVEPAAVESFELSAPAAEPVDEPADTERTEPVDKPARRGLLRRSRRRTDGLPSAEAEPVEVAAEVVDAEPVEALTEPEPVLVAAAVEPEPVVEPEPAPVAEAAEPEPAPVLADQVVEREPFPAAEPAPLPDPVLPPVGYAAAIDVLPSRTARTGRFGRHREPAPAAPAPAPYVPVAFAPAAPPVVPAASVAPAPVATPVPLPVPLPVPAAPAAAPAFTDESFPASPVTGTPAADEPPAAPPEQAGPLAVPLTPMPRRSAAPVPVSASAVLAALPSEADPASRAVPVTPPEPPDLDRMAAHAEMHSSALSELRGLYEPSFTPAVAPPAPEEAPAGGLTRRTPKAATEDAGPPPAAPARTRSADDVRGMLSGFRAGIERGRSSTADGTDATTDSPTS